MRKNLLVIASCERSEATRNDKYLTGHDINRIYRRLRNAAILAVTLPPRWRRYG